MLQHSDQWQCLEAATQQPENIIKYTTQYDTKSWFPPYLKN